MRSIDAEGARAQFTDVLREVKSGETVVVTVRGVPVARFFPVQERNEDAAEAIDDWKRYRRNHSLTPGDDTTIRGRIEECRNQGIGHLTRSGHDEDDRGS